MGGAAGSDPLRHYQRLAMVRGFAAYLRVIDPRCEVPPRNLLPEGRRRVPPHIYREEEIATLISLSRLLRPPVRAATIETAIALLTVTGMRSGELVRLDRGDIDLAAGRLQIIATKFNKSRAVALHPTTVSALDLYRLTHERNGRSAAAIRKLGATDLGIRREHLVGRDGTRRQGRIFRLDRPGPSMPA